MDCFWSVGAAAQDGTLAGELGPARLMHAPANTLPTAGSAVQSTGVEADVPNLGIARAPRRGRRTLVVLALAAAIVVIPAATWFAPWAPLAHWTCQTGNAVARETDRWIPAVLVNSPYLGSASGNGSMSWTFPGAWNGPPPAPGQVLRTGWGTSASNGTAAAALFMVNATLYRLVNLTAWGPGTNTRCSGAYSAELDAPSIYGGSSTLIHTHTNLSDADEASNISAFDSPSNVSRLVFIDDGFTRANEQYISTCGSPGVTRPFVTSFLTAGLPFTVGGRTVTAPYIFPFVQAFNYTFPADGGIWQVDDLAIGPNAPGGGWAFSYTPCP